MAVFFDCLVGTAAFDTMFGCVGYNGSISLHDFNLGKSAGSKNSVHEAYMAGLAASGFDVVEVVLFGRDVGRYSVLFDNFRHTEFVQELFCEWVEVGWGFIGSVEDLLCFGSVCEVPKV